MPRPVTGEGPALGVDRGFSEEEAPSWFLRSARRRGACELRCFPLRRNFLEETLRAPAAQSIPWPEGKPGRLGRRGTCDKGGTLSLVFMEVLNSSVVSELPRG